MVVGERIQERLKAVGLSQSELARRVGVSQPMVNALIRGSTRSTPKLHRIARELGTTPGYLSGEVDDPDQDAPELPPLSRDEAEWLVLLNSLDAANRAAVLQIVRTMAATAGLNAANVPKSRSLRED